jgi:6-pyruvoyltetrahydropterin/6-carboxytetrahydropterin synthase
MNLVEDKPMYQLTVESHFDAAHALRGYQGKCENVHGHRFRVMAKVRASKLDSIGLAYDFTELKAKLNEVLRRFDHTSLGEVLPFDSINPSSENLASVIYREMKGKLAGTPVSLYSIEVWESPECGVEYRPSTQML